MIPPRYVFIPVFIASNLVKDRVGISKREVRVSEIEADLSNSDGGISCSRRYVSA